MIRHTISWSLLLLVTLIPAFGKEVLDKIIAKVDNAVITLSDLQEAAAPSISQIKENYSPDQWEAKIMELKNQILMRMIDEYILLRAARDLEISVTDEELDMHVQNMWKSAGIEDEETFKRELDREGMTLEELRNSIKKQIIGRKVLQREVYSKVKVSEGDIKTYYLEHQSAFTQPAKIRVALLVRKPASTTAFGWKMAEELIQQIYQQAVNGADFSSLVQEYSQGPATEQGGDIGFMIKGEGLPAFEEVAFALKVNEISKPFKTEHGWNIIKVLEQSEETVQPLEEVKSDIENMLRILKSKDLESEWLAKERQKTYIERKPL